MKHQRYSHRFCDRILSFILGVTGVGLFILPVTANGDELQSKTIALQLTDLQLTDLQPSDPQLADFQPTSLNSRSLRTAQASHPIALVQSVTSVGMTVADMEQALAFYTQVLDFQIVKDVEVAGRPYELLQGVFGLRMRVVTLQLGEEQIELTEYLTPQGRPIPGDSRSNDLWFQHIAIVVSDMDAAYQKLRQFRVEHVSTNPQQLPDYIPAAAGIEAFYFRDPDDNTLEIIAFPPGKGNPRWQNPTDRLFLGIDHTAIGISSTPNSQAFYETLLGLSVAGDSENYGPEQERLNQVFGARLQITGLKAPQGGIGVEFLEYLSPRTGRPYPPDSHANDGWHWDITMTVADAAVAAQRLRSAGVPFISNDVIQLPTAELGFQRGFLVRDPDGHAVRIIELNESGER